ncbi:MAG: hypothetical protein WC760_12750 [Bacteroidia bacterium]
MLSAAIFLIYAFLVAWVSGIVCLHLFSKLLRTEFTVSHALFLLVPGLCLDALLLQILHLFLPMGWMVHLLILMVLTALVLPVKAEWNKYLTQLKQDCFGSPLHVIFFMVVFCAAILNLAGRAGVGDIGDYHLQAIRWDEQFPVVKGLGNLRRQLGNNSNWFLLHAYFGMGFFGLKSVYVLNALLLIVSTVYFIPRKNDPNFILKGVIFLYLILMAYRKYVGAVTNDYAITILTLITFTEWIQQPVSDWRKRAPLLLVFLTMVTFKLSAITLLFIPVGWLLMQKLDVLRKGITVLTLFCLLLFTPWLQTNVLKSGYLLYPVDQLDLFDVDWKMRAETLQYERAINIANERVPGVDLETVKQMPFTQWFVQWIKHLDLFSKFLLALFVVDALFLMIALLIRRSRKRWKEIIRKEHSALLLITIALAMPVWFMNAPATRFIFGYLVFYIAWMFQHRFTISRFNHLFQARWVMFGGMVLLIAGGIFFTKLYLPADRFQRNLITLLPYGTNTMQRVPLPLGGYVMMPEGNAQCWDAEIPCTSILDPNLQWRTNRLEDGFKMKNEE